MCFSAGASFAGGVIISAIGVATVLKVHKPSQIVFASIPLFFGFQQFVEGFVWLILQRGSGIQTASGIFCRVSSSKRPRYLSGVMATTQR